jgi:hypothetical protein
MHGFYCFPTANSSHNYQAGSVILNLWADGGVWSGQPSTTNVTMNLQSILVYYNTTDSNSGNDDDFNQACEAAGGIHKMTVCEEQSNGFLKATSAATSHHLGWTTIVPVILMILLDGSMTWKLKSMSASSATI